MSLDTAQVYLLIVYAPRQSCNSLKEALFEAGAGRIGHYDCCCWQVDGRGQFRPLPGAQPHLGQVNQIEEVAETRLEMMVAADVRAAVEKSLHHAHPYETPAYFWLAADNTVAC